MTLGNDQLKIIAHELLQGLKANATIDWAHRDSARDRLRALLKRILLRRVSFRTTVRQLLHENFSSACQESQQADILTA